MDKISGKGLSTNDYTNTDKAELSALTDEIGEHTKNNTIHITSTERNAWNAKVGKTDSISDNIVNYTESSVLSELSSGEKMSIAYGKLKSAVKNVIANVKLLGTTDISAIGNGTVTGAVSALNSNLNQKLDRYNNSLTITSVKETPSNSTGYSTSNFLAETPKGSGTTNRCGYGFHYPGVIGGLLTMNPNDGLLYFVTHNGYTYKIDMTKQ